MVPITFLTYINTGILTTNNFRMMDPDSIELQPVEKYNASYLRKEELGRGKFGVVFQVNS